MIKFIKGLVRLGFVSVMTSIVAYIGGTLLGICSYYWCETLVILGILTITPIMCIIVPIGVHLVIDGSIQLYRWSKS